MASRWRAYLPTFRWGRFRLLHEDKDGAYMPIRMTQIIGGKWWSLSLTRTSPARKVEPVEIPYEVFETDMLAAFRVGAHHDEWEKCITHGADRTLSGLRAALIAAGITVAQPASSRRGFCAAAEQDAGVTGSSSSEVDRG